MGEGARLRRPFLSAPLAWLLGAVAVGAVVLLGATPSFAATASFAETASSAANDPSAANAPSAAAAAAAAAQPDSDIVLYWGDGCPNCENEREWLATVAKDHPDLTITQYEVWKDADNRALFVAAGKDLGFEASSVPTTVIGERVWIGWTTPIKEDVADAIDLVLAGKTPPPGVYGTPGAGTCNQDEGVCTVDDEGVLVDVPLVGEVALGDKSLLVSTLIIGFVDGVNPCSLWVISVLLTIVIRTASRRRVVAIGSVFLGVTAGMYALYMAGIYSALSVVDSLGAIQVIVALAAGIFGVVSVKDYFAFKKGLSFTIKDSAKPGIYKRIRDAAGHRALVPALAATVVLAVAVSLLETPCTAGFPVLWTGMLRANGVGFAETALLFVAYMIPFLLDEMIVFGIAVATMKATKMQEKHGEMLKLIGGVTMLALAAVMVFAPSLMENPLGALALFAGAFALAAVIHLVTSKVRARRSAVGAEKNA
jgi:hypothetical protein